MRVELIIEPGDRIRSLRRTPRRRLAAVAVALALIVPGVVYGEHLFSDVPSEHTFHADIAAFAGAGITAGCGPDVYCPDAAVTRGQMAAFLRRGLGRATILQGINVVLNGTQEQTAATVSITPGTSSGAIPGATQYVWVQFDGTARLTNAASCPCTVAIYLPWSDLAPAATLSTTTAWVPISVSSLVPVAGSGQFSADLTAYITDGGTATTQYTLYGSMTAMVLPFGSVQYTQLGGAATPGSPVGDRHNGESAIGPLGR